MHSSSKATRHRQREEGIHSTSLRSICLYSALIGAWTPSLQAQGLGIATLGASGGLVVPSAYVLNDGEFSISTGNYHDAHFDPLTHSRNFLAGVGMLPGVEVFGRYSEYLAPRKLSAGGVDLMGDSYRDISMSAKWQLPLGIKGWPQVALGATDLAGHTQLFRSVYVVVSDEYGPLRWSLGAARSSQTDKRSAPVLKSLFTGAELRLGSTQTTAMAEWDGRQGHVGLRYYSEPQPWMHGAQFIATIQHTLGAEEISGKRRDAGSFQLAVVVPLAPQAQERRTRTDATLKPLLPIDHAPASGLVSTAADRLERLARTIRASGLDRVRVGMLDNEVVVEFENHRYPHDEADALGIVLGLAVEQAPAGSARVHAIALKAGLPAMTATVDVAAFRSFLRDAESTAVRSGFGFSRLSHYDRAEVAWADGEAGAGAARNRVRFEIKPLLNYVLGSEYGSFDHSLAANVRTALPLWSGSQLHADWVQRVDHSRNFALGNIYANSLHRNGLRNLALQQSMWLGPQWLVSAGVGRFAHDFRGVQAQSILFLPFNTDEVHLKGVATRRERFDPGARDPDGFSFIYRRHLNTTTWLEAGYQRYADRSSGPSLEFQRWFGDVAVSIFLRKGDRSSFGGMQMSLPLTPRQGMAVAPAEFSGTARYAQPLRLRLSGSSSTTGAISETQVRHVELAYDLEQEVLNSGRTTREHMLSQLQRMRESFYLYARDQLD